MIYKSKTGRIPENLNIKEIVENSLIEKNKTYKKYVTEGIVYFLSLLCIDEDYPEHMIDNGFIILNDKVLQEVIGKGGKNSRTAEIKRILKNHSVINSIPYSKMIKSSGFRITEFYNTGYYKEVNFSDRIAKKLTSEKLKSLINKEINIFEKKGKKTVVQYESKEYPHLNEQFIKHNLLVNHNLLKSFFESIIYKFMSEYSICKFEHYSYLSLFSFIGRSIKSLQKIERGNININVSDNNHRYYNGLTNLPKVLRQFLLIDGKEIGEVDMSACQVFILSSILNLDFCNEESTSRYHIKNIYPELLTAFENLDMVNFSRCSENNNYILGEYFNDTNKVEIEKFSNFDFVNMDFYTKLAEDIIEKKTKNLPATEKKKYKNKINRDAVKKNIMNILFNYNYMHRESSEINVGFDDIYPQVNSFITLFHRLYSARDFALLLQRCEAFIVLENVTSNILLNHPSIPIFTIHDCIITTMDNIDLVEHEMVKEIEKLTQKRAGVKSKQISYLAKDHYPVGIDEILAKHKITTKASLDRKLINIQESNINTALKYLYGNDPREFKQWQDKLKRIIQS